MITPPGGNVFLYIYITYLYVDYDYDMNFHVTVMLRNTTDLYRRSVIDIAYGEIIFSLHRGCMGDDSSGRMVGVSA